MHQHLVGRLRADPVAPGPDQVVAVDAEAASRAAPSSAIGRPPRGSMFVQPRRVGGSDLGVGDGMGSAQAQVLAPGCGNELNADRQCVPEDGYGRHRQSDAGNRLCEQADVGPERHRFALQDHRLLAELRGEAGRRRRDDQVDGAEQPHHLVVEPATRPLSLEIPGRRLQGAGEKTVAGIGVEIIGTLLQPPEMEGRTLAVRDQESGRPRDARSGDVDHPRRTERLRDGGDRGLRLRHRIRREMAAGDRDAQAGHAIVQRR